MTVSTRVLPTKLSHGQFSRTPVETRVHACQLRYLARQLQCVLVFHSYYKYLNIIYIYIYIFIFVFIFIYLYIYIFIFIYIYFFYLSLYVYVYAFCRVILTRSFQFNNSRLIRWCAIISFLPLKEAKRDHKWARHRSSSMDFYNRFYNVHPWFCVQCAYLYVYTVY